MGGGMRMNNPVPDTRGLSISRNTRKRPEKRETSRDRRLTNFFKNSHSRMFTIMDNKDSDIVRGVPGQFDDAPEPRKRPKAVKSNIMTFSEQPSYISSKTSQEILTTLLVPRSPLVSLSFLFPLASSSEASDTDSLSQTSSSSSSDSLDAIDASSGRVVTAARGLPVPIPRAWPVVSGQFDDCETDDKTIANESKVHTENESPVPLPEYPYYLVVRKVYSKYVQTTPLIPYQNITSLHNTSEENLFFTCNRLCSSSYTKGFFWCVRNPLEGIKGCRVDLPDTLANKDRSDGLKNWRLNSPNVNTNRNNFAAAMYDVPITAAKPMSNRLIFFGDDVGKVGVAWYYFFDELDKYAYKIEQCRIEMSKYLRTGLFDVVWTDKSWIKNHNSRVTAVDVCPRDGRTVVSGSSNGSVFTWNADVFQIKNRFPKIAGENGEITSVCFSPHSLDCFVSASKDGTFLLWDIREVKPFRVAHFMRNKYLTSLEWNPRYTNSILGGTSSGEILTFDVRRPGAWEYLGTPFDGEVNNIVSHPTSSHFAASCLSEIKHFHGLTASTCSTIHTGGMRKIVSGITFYKDYVLSVDKNSFLTAIKL